ncbi:DDE-type integrase/transposase/recombinase [Enterovibrio norvegicus]|nr:DDE-type integrase/transposase/recombinase [Enterovibrio norvegicus]
MPWKETCKADKKVSLVGDWLSGNYTKTMLSRRYGVSRPTVDKWLNRYIDLGVDGLVERSRRPLTCSHQTDPKVIEAILNVKQEHVHWGPKKINDRLASLYPEQRWPADSTTGAILKNAGLVKPRKHKPRVSPYPHPLTSSTYSCDVWNIDFKGDKALGNGKRCYPLTVTDDFSRYLLACEGLESTALASTQVVLEKLFEEHGLPNVIKSDNGTPFASRSIGGLSRLSIWLIKLGIVPERIDKGCPTQNARHERMHRVLKAETMSPMSHSFKAQQKRFDEFRFNYNELRSHEGLNRKTPKSVYRQSPVRYSDRELRIFYADDTEIRSVKHSGEIKWKGKYVYVGQLLACEKIALKRCGEKRWELYFGFFLLGYLNEDKMVVERIKART